ncbi:MAG: NADH-quinone oxidoreductase subunit N, partial [Propionibacteriaceae bacterium]
GLLFKIGAVPFHMWTPDVYQGSPTPVTAFMAICTKLAAVVALLRVLYVALSGAQWDWQLMISVIAVLTIVVGTILAVTQTDMKRMLAYSSVSHAGFILVALCGVTVGASGSSVSAILFYLAAYGLATLGAFAIVMSVRKDSSEATAIADWAGIGRKNPFFGVAFSVFLMSFAGLPLTAGFIGKVGVFMAAWKGGYFWLVIIAVLLSVVAAFFYMRVIVVMFAQEPVAGVDVVTPGMHAQIPVIVGFVATLVLGLWPAPVLDLVNKAAIFLF